MEQNGGKLFVRLVEDGEQLVGGLVVVGEGPAGAYVEQPDPGFLLRPGNLQLRGPVHAHGQTAVAAALNRADCDERGGEPGGDAAGGESVCGGTVEGADSERA